VHTVLAAALVGAAVLLLLPPPSGMVRLRGTVGRSGPCSRPGSGSAKNRLSSPQLMRWAPTAAAALAGLCSAVLVGGPYGLAFGAAVAVAVAWWLRRLEPAGVQKRRRRLASDLPLAVDLLSACLAAGRPPRESLDAVAAAVGGPTSEELGAVSARLALGADPASVWRGLTGDPVLAPLARTMLRALETGAPVAQGLSRLVDDQRRARRWEAEQRARAVGVKAAAPLALCFLPAFVTVGVIPTIASAASQLIGG
jgi:Flp pilus assembly protein TadB